MDFIIKRKVLISMLFLGLSMLGYVSWKNLSMELFPNAELPMLYVQVTCQQEVDPKFMESQAIIPIEGAIGTLQGIENMESTCQSRRGTIMVEFNKKVNFKYIYLKLQEKITEIKSTIPEQFIVTVVKVDLTQLNKQFMQLQVRGSGGVDLVRNITDQKIKPELQNVDGIAGINIFGGHEKSIEIQLDMDVCNAYKLTAANIRSKLAQNYRTRAYAGDVFGSNLKYTVQVTSEFDDLAQIENLVIAPGPILLKDVAKVYFGTKEQTSYSRVNGKDAVSITLVNDAQSNLIELSEKTLAVIAKLNKDLAYKEIEITVQNNAAETMSKNLNQIGELALVGAILAIFVLWIFLKNIRLVSIIALAIPISVLTAFNFFYYNDVTINSLTLVGMALAVGILLDNSVVVLENIYRLRATGKSPRDAVIQGTTEVWRSVLAATLTTTTVFLPFLFSDNFLIKLLGKNIGISIISTLMVSLIVAMLLVPMMAYAFLKKKAGGSMEFTQVSTRNKLVQAYVMLLKYSLRKPAQTIIGALIFFFVTIFICLAVSMSTLNEVKTNAFRINITMPSGSTIESSDKVVSEVENRIKGVEEIKDVTCNIQVESASVMVELKEDYEKIKKRSLSQIRDEVTNKVNDVPGGTIDITDASSTGGDTGASGMGGSGTGNFMKMMGVGSNWERIVIKGQDFEVMKNVASDLQYFLESLESMNGVRVSYSNNRPEVHLRFHPLMMNAYDVSLNSVSGELNSFSKEINTNIPFKQGNEQYDITIKEMPKKGQTAEEAKRSRTAFDLRTLPVADTKGGLHELQNISDVVLSSGYASITRVNQEKQIEVRFRFVDASQDSKDLLESYRAEVDKVVESYNMPSGVAIQVIHEEDTLKDFYFLILAAFVLIFMIMASVFESVSTPFVLMFSIPLAAIGSFLALIFTNNSLFNANTLIGFLILIGVVVNNGIILIDYTQILRKRGFRKNRALVMAGMSRLRPILITAIATIAAMLPLAMGDNEYVGAIGAPFAITVIGGLSLSTLLTLVFIPTFYSGLETTLQWMRDLNWKIKIVQGVLLVSGIMFVYYRVDALLWQILDLVALVIVIPGTTWFIMNSLRKATETVIDPDKQITIKIENLVKIYDWGSRFAREWKGNTNIRERAGQLKYYRSIRDFDLFIWQLPLLGFLGYFTFNYLRNGLYALFFALLIYFMALAMWQPVAEYLNYRAEKENKKWRSKLAGIGKQLLFWGLPFLTLVFFYFKWEKIVSVAVIGVLWYFALAVKTTADHLYVENVNIERLKGRFAKIRRVFFKIVEQMPLIGRKRDPFKALKGVSLEINTGMIGLLGPNGAGKSTMMRIICGIYEQNYGKVWINGIDTLEKREELQGLIGYLPQEFGTYENMSAYEFLDYQAILKGLTDGPTRDKRIEYCLSSVHLWDRKDDKIGGFSGGMKQRMGIAQILLHLPRILVVDEPTAGLDPRERIRFRNLLVELSRERIVIFSTHIIEDISSSCNQVAVVNRGELCYAGHPNDMVKLAEGFVWQFTIPAKEFDAFPLKERVIHHMRDGEMIKMRFLSAEKPTEDAVVVKPVLEEAYLCILKGFKKKI
ncbi:MAG: efflux RND transporter permease subunit [Prolixibacteraceae bacterium]|jgi:multidrug efflux pump subunit AcrB/ABC-type multidrug transport system ATPase subunit|nr:efflux RND transporter permease subunit [Prolixibacteraceae bacterium]